MRGFWRERPNGEPLCSGAAAAAPPPPAAASPAPRRPRRRAPPAAAGPSGRPFAVVAAAAAGPPPEGDEADEGAGSEGYEEDFEDEEGLEEGEEEGEAGAGAAQQQQQPLRRRGQQPEGGAGGGADEGEFAEDEDGEGEDGEGEDGEGEDEGGAYPEPPARGYYLPDLLAMSAEEALAAEAQVQAAANNTIVYGLTNEVSRIVGGDMFVCHVSFDLEHGLVDRHEQIAEAVAAGASCILAAAQHRDSVEAVLEAMAAQRRGEAAGEGEEAEEGEDEGEGEGEGAAGPPPARGSSGPREPSPEAGVPGVRVLEGVTCIFADELDDMAAKLAAAFYDGPSLAMRVVAVTGSSGKTTVSWLVRGVLEELGQLTGMVGSVEYGLAEDRLDAEGDLWEADQPDPTAERECTSPFHLAPYKGKYRVDYPHDMDGMRLQKLLAGMRDRGATAAVVEASAEALVQGWMEYVDADVVVWTCFEEEPRHIALHRGSSEAYLESKLSLFEAMRDSERQRAVVNMDDEASARVLNATSVPAVTYAIRDRRADVWAESMQLTAWETEVIVRVPGGRRLQIISSLVGRHNVYNILAAVAVGIVLGAPLEAIVAGIEAVTVVPGRSEIVNADPEDPVLRGDFPVVVDAADSPARVATVLDSLREAGAARIFAVMGADGETTSRTMRTQMGAAAFMRADTVIVTNVSPRRELPEEIVADMMAGLPEKVLQSYSTYVYNPFQDQGRVPLWFEPWLHSAQRTHKRHVMEDRFSAIRAAIGTARPNDVVLLLGQGHRDWVEHWDGNEEEPGLVRGWFDDRVEARNALSKLEYLYSLVHLDRSQLPWGHSNADFERSGVWEEPIVEEAGPGAGGGGARR
ncbi:hypothetical protein Rsub_04109 [Raphidocelis subcapitata]|uniref:Mur ligase central domain-containing protein n=1 Tax=Raphidocelis subcapitata TaxID=307507 RepID=A0A2V0NVL0_9CHLO|nr:hypothetical protein Rsub_04109 [Raphidocelis subcapitata]|eukprot:GBF91369.1 hypothetical protein Rsub_04109 [Raphidocelis subcapitata]